VSCELASNKEVQNALRSEILASSDVPYGGSSDDRFPILDAVYKETLQSSNFTTSQSPLLTCRLAMCFPLTQRHVSLCPRVQLSVFQWQLFKQTSGYGERTLLNGTLRAGWGMVMARKPKICLHLALGTVCTEYFGNLQANSLLLELECASEKHLQKLKLRFASVAMSHF
jgi:hypothetical protein